MFLTACSPKFMKTWLLWSYFSCTENFNQVLNLITSHHVHPRQLLTFSITPLSRTAAGSVWTNRGPDLVGIMCCCEPTVTWSVPGSACPDDIDSTNGWIPTDIHVRIYAETEYFNRSQHYRITPEEQPRMTMSSGFFQESIHLPPKSVNIKAIGSPMNMMAGEQQQSIWLAVNV